MHIKNPVYSSLLILVLFFSGMRMAAAQDIPRVKMLTQDTTPVEELEYHLSRAQFIHYYGIDDTSRALINMFFRKRTNAVINFCVPGGSFFLIELLSGGGDIILNPGFIFSGGSVGLTLVGVFVGVYMVRGIVQRISYSKQLLLYTLVDRERGMPIPEMYLSRIKPVDFY